MHHSPAGSAGGKLAGASISASEDLPTEHKYNLANDVTWSLNINYLLANSKVSAKVDAAGTFFGVAGGVSTVTVSKEDIEFEAFPFAWEGTPMIVHKRLSNALKRVVVKTYTFLASRWRR